MFEVSVQEHFDAAHYLRGYQGKCERLHGHRFQVMVTLRAPGVDEIGLAYDFVELKRHLRGILEQFDHVCLNETPPFDRINPSSENIAITIYEGLQERLAGISISSVQVCESPDACVTYLPWESG
ncbi:MAG: 6-carboxytetrahydropterin synthase QueD [Dehalococcoidia bacterium]